MPTLCYDPRMRNATLALLSLLAFLAPNPGRAEDDECAIQPAVVPDFALVDVNTGSATYGQTLKRDDFLGRVMVIYWAVST